MSPPVDDLPRWLPWVVPIGFVTAVLALVGLGDATASLSDRVFFTIVPLVVATVVLVGASVAAESLVLAAVLAATAPSVVVSMAGAEPEALVAVVGALVGLIVAGPQFASFDPGVRVLAAASAFVVVAGAWVVATPARDGPVPSWRSIVSQTGESLRRTVVGVGADGRTVALASLLAWLLAVGLLVGVALLSDRPMIAVAVPVAFAVVVIGTWLVERWRGPVDAGSAMWALSAATVFTAASARRHLSESWLVGRSVSLLAALALGLGVAHQIRRAGGADLRLVVGALAAAATAAPAWWWAARRPGGGVMPDSIDRTATSVSAMHTEVDRP